jgi:sphingolipid 8-(E)-desaturase
MLSLQIGRIEGQWRNFKPPIQGGQFRLSHESQEEEFADDESTESDSSSGTPVFDDEVEGLKKRKQNGVMTPISSVSSEDISNSPNPSKVTYLDAITQKEIDFDLAKYPALDLATQRYIIQRYRALHEQMKAEGLFDCNYWAYGIETIRYSLFFSGFLYFLHIGWYSLSGLFLGLLWHQLSFTVHDAGHMGITHDFQTDTLISIFIADFIGGLSAGWWKRSHNIHHIVTNSTEHDPDIQHMPFFAVSHQFFGGLFSTYHDKILHYDAFAKRLIRLQHYLYYPILLFGRFNLYAQSWIFLIRGFSPKKGPARWHSTIEITCQVLYWIWFGYGVVYRSIPTGWDRFTFLMISHMVTAPLHVQITLSHFAMSTSDLGVNESFPQRMLRTTMDVDCPQWLDFFHGGLQFQAIHHLFPRMPRHNLRRAQKLVQAFCKEVDIPYALLGFVEGNKDVIGRLGEVGRQAAMLAKCQQAISELPDFGMHQ